MAHGKKIFLLSLLLLLLIATCVYNHIKELVYTPSIIMEEKVKKLVEEEIEEKPLKEIDPLNTNLNDNITEEIIKNKEQIEEKPLKEAIPLNMDLNDNIVEEKIKKEEIVLKRIDKGYRRSKEELVYIKLSPKIKKIQNSLYILMKNEPFEFTKNGINYISKNDEMLSKIVEIMNKNKSLKFEIAGHAKIRTNDEKYNTYISVMRAANIKKKLISIGIDKNRIKARGYGSKIPLSKDNIEILDRIEFNIIGE